MATFVLIPGAGSDGWFWHPVVERLSALGHDTVAVDLPWGDERATFGDLADVVVDAIAADRPHRATDGQLIVVAQSLGGFVGPLVCARVQSDLLVMVAAMVPRARRIGRGMVDQHRLRVAGAVRRARHLLP